MKRGLNEAPVVSARSLTECMRDMWREGDRAKTLARIAVHKRQFENWWKFELATYLWERADRHGLYSFVESFGRADVSLGRLSEEGTFDIHAATRIPIELKTVGTWWKDMSKALREPGKKRLDADMAELVNGKRNAAPFGMVALLVTHAPPADESRYARCLKAARAIGVDYGLSCALDEEINLPVPAIGYEASAHQFAWVR